MDHGPCCGGEKKENVSMEVVREFWIWALALAFVTCITLEKLPGLPYKIALGTEQNNSY